MPTCSSRIRRPRRRRGLTLTSDVPVVAERAMYWPTGDGHVGLGATEPATRWALPHLPVGAQAIASVTLNRDSYILIENPRTTAANVTLTVLREQGAPIVKTYTVPPQRRVTLNLRAEVPALRDEAVGAIVESTNGTPIVVEGSVYWSTSVSSAIGGTNVMGIPMP